MGNPAVSVLIASYNYESYLSVTLESVLQQSWQDFEILVVDDGSSDRSVELAEAFAARDKRVRVLRHPGGVNRGLPATLQLGIASAHGDFIAFLEADDLWLPTCLEQRFAALHRTPDTNSAAGVVFNGIAALPMPGADTGWFQGYVPRVMRTHATRNTAQNMTFSLRNPLLFENVIPTFSCSMARRALLLACDWHSPVPRWIDWWIWIQLAEMTRFCFVPAELTRWRLHQKSYNHRISSSYLAEGTVFWKEVRKRRLKRGLLSAKYSDLPVLLPFLTVPLLRFFSIVRECGLRATLKRVRKRL